MKRKLFIDNLRTLVILLLFPFHSLRMFTSMRPFYVQGTPFLFADGFMVFCSLWFMNLLFVLAGMSAFYSLKKRSISAFVKERFSRLLLPFISGLLLIVPVQTFFAEKMKNHFQGSYLEQYLLFFTKKGDLTGYTGGFTPGHLWFLFFLFLISIISLPVIFYVKRKAQFPFSFQTASAYCKYKLLLLFFPYALLSLWEAGEPIGRYLFCFLLGFCLLSKEELLSYLKTHTLFFSICGGILALVYTLLSLYQLQHSFTAAYVSTVSYLFMHLSSLAIIYALLGLGQRFLDFSNTITHYFAKNSFSIYFVHQSILVAVGYFLLTYTNSRPLQVLLTMCITLISSIVCVELIKKVPVLHTLFGM